MPKRLSDELKARIKQAAADLPAEVGLREGAKRLSVQFPEVDNEVLRSYIRMHRGTFDPGRQARFTVRNEVYQRSVGSIGVDAARERAYWAARMPQFAPGEGLRRSLVVSDVEFPFERDDIDTILQRYSGYDTLVLNGDLFHLEHLAAWATDRDYKLLDLLIYGHRKISKWAGWFRHIVATSGNHDARLGRRLMERLRGVGVIECFETDLLTIFSHGFARVNPKTSQILEVFPALPSFIYPRSYWFLWGDQLILHPHDKPWKILENYMREWDDRMISLPYRLQYNGIVMGHAHRYCDTLSRDRFRRLRCTGAMCWGLPYVEGGHRWYYPQQGFFDLLQNDGITVEEESTLVRLPEPAMQRRLTEMKLEEGNEE